MIITLE